jgi:hypothetical protein
VTIGNRNTIVAERSPREAFRLFLHGVVGSRVKRTLNRLDDIEVRHARLLVRGLRSSHPPDVVAFGDSNWLFRAAYDDDLRNLAAMIADDLGDDVSMKAYANAGYYSTLMRAYVRLIELSSVRPVVIVPLCARFASVAWSTHPAYTYARAIEVIDGFTDSTPTWRMRKSASPPEPSEFAAYGATRIHTFNGVQTIDELRGAILSPSEHGISDHERRKLLYAYHHGESITPDAPYLAEVTELGRALRRLGRPPVVFETTVPVDEGVALWGEQFRYNAANTLELMREALRQGYGDHLPILETGLVFDRDEFIDPADGSEHLNQRGRKRLASLVAAATREALLERSARI